MSIRTLINTSESFEMPTNNSFSVIPLDQETRIAIDTASAAFHLNRKPQTLRIWACMENGPIRPIRVNGRLAWRIADIRTLLGE